MSKSHINTKHHKKKFSLEERKNYYLAWKQSQLNTTHFCQAHQISKSALYQWIKAFEKENNDSDFSPLMIEHPSSAPSTTVVPLTIAFSNTTMQITIQMPAHHLVSFIQEMGHAATIIR